MNEVLAPSIIRKMRIRKQNLEKTMQISSQDNCNRVLFERTKERLQ